MRLPGGEAREHALAFVLSATGRWLRPRRGVRRDMQLSLGDAAGYGAMVGAAETYVPAFGLALGMSPVSAGLIASVPLLVGGVLQLVAPRLIARMSSMRAWVAWSTAIQALAFVPLIIIALTHTTSTPLVFACVSLYWAAGNCAAAGWMPWMARVVPARVRGRFFGRRQSLVQGATLVGLIGAGIMLQSHANQTGEGPMWIYVGIFALAMVSRLVSTFCIVRMGRGVDPTPRRRTRLRSLPPKLWRTQRGVLIGYLVAMGAAVAVSSPFLTPYLLLEQHFNYAQYCAFTATIFVVKIVMLPIVGRLIPKVGLRRVLTISALAIVPIPFMWFVSGHFWWFIAAQVYGGIAWAGFDLGMLMALFDADDDSERISMQVMFSALQAIGNAAASLAGGAVLGMFGADHRAYLMVFVLSAASRVVAATMILRELPRLILRIPRVVFSRAWILVMRRDRSAQ